MHVKQLKLVNFRRFGELTIPFFNEKSPVENCNTVVFIGDNGAGKTAILNALAMSLSWLIARINREKGNGSAISDMDILNGENASIIGLQLENNRSLYHWTLAKSRIGVMLSKTSNSEIPKITKLATLFREQLSHNNKTSLPLITYYPAERAVLEIPLEIKNRQGFEQLSGYDNTLQQRVDFREFFEWFRNREDVENELDAEKMEQVEKLILKLELFRDDVDASDNLSTEEKLKMLSEFGQLYKMDKQLRKTLEPQLTSVREAIKSFMPDFENLRIQRKPYLRMLVDKNGKTLDVGQLSQGEKSLMALVGDIARRLAMMNPSLENPLEGEGIVLIDEVDMHLHPKWQRIIISKLNTTFPNCQFILTTHSPIVISETPNLLCYSLNDGKLEKLNNLYGMDVNQVLLQDMDAEIRNADIQDAFDNLRDTLQDGHLEEAKGLLAALEQKISIDHIELSKARLLIRRLEIQNAKNH